MKRSLLIEEPPLQILPSLAAAIGLNEAIVLQQLYWLLQQPNNGKEVDGHKWIFNTLEQWQKTYFPFWSLDTIQRTFEELHKKHIVEWCQPEGRASRRKYYRVNFGALERLNFEQLAEDRRLRLSGKKASRTPQIAVMGTPQIAVIEEGSLPPSLDTKTSSETSAKTSFEKKFANAQIPTLKTPIQKPPRGAAPLPELEGELLDLRDDWERWKNHLIQKGKPLTPLQAEAQIALLWKMSHDDAVESIDRAIIGGYTAFLLKKETPKRTEAANVNL